MIARRCVHCRQLHLRTNLIRVICNKASQTVVLQLPCHQSPQEKQSLIVIQGRSSYVCPTVHCLQPALKFQKLQKTLKCRIPGDILGVLSQELEGLKSGDTTQSKNL